MNKSTQLYLSSMALLGCALISSCKNEEITISGIGDVPATFSGSIGEMTRVSGTNWSSNDSIGIFMLQHNSSTLSNEVENYSYVTSGDGIFSPSNTEQTIFYPLNKSKVDFTAYYPYQKNPALYSYTITNWNSSRQDTLDLLVAKATGHSQADPEVSFSFKHQFSKLNVLIGVNNETGLTVDDLAGMSIAIEGINKPATYHLLNQSVSYSETLNEAVSLQVSADGKTADAILPSTSGTKAVFTLANGSTFDWDISSIIFESGKSYTYAITLKAAEKYVEAVLTSTINDWNSVEGEEINLSPDEMVYISGTYGGHTYVDLGLPSGLLWATCDVGTTSPEEQGNGYYWGETEVRNSNNSLNKLNDYKFCHIDDTTMIKYLEGYWIPNDYLAIGSIEVSHGNDKTEEFDACSSRVSPLLAPQSTTANEPKTRLDLDDDAANVNWGANWRMGTSVEWRELIDNCTVQEAVFHGVNLLQVIGPNGNCLYLRRFTTGYGNYWTSDCVATNGSAYGQPNRPTIYVEMIVLSPTSSWISANDFFYQWALPVRPVVNPKEL